MWDHLVCVSLLVSLDELGRPLRLDAELDWDDNHPCLRSLPSGYAAYTRLGRMLSYLGSRSRGIGA